MANKQTVAYFLEESIHLHCLINDTEDVMIDYNTLDKLFMQAKAMEKEQIMQSYKDGMGVDSFDNAEQYYEETYGK